MIDLSSTADMEEIQQPICAFANDLPNTGKPGVLFVGVDDNGKASGLAVTDALLLELAQIRDHGNIPPLPSMAVEKVKLKGADVVAIVVEPSLAPPVRYRGRVDSSGTTPGDCVSGRGTAACGKAAIQRSVL